MTINAVEFKQLLGKARDAARGGRSSWDVQSTGERVAVALVLNRADWLAAMNYTLAEAIDRTGPEWLSLVPKVAKQLVDDGEYPVCDSPN
jgi:hypothetical protein